MVNNYKANKNIKKKGENGKMKERNGKNTITTIKSIILSTG